MGVILPAWVEIMRIEDDCHDLSGGKSPFSQ
jgi:hypothetical protein